jgi:hypothetical protein
MRQEEIQRGELTAEFHEDELILSGAKVAADGTGEAGD